MIAAIPACFADDAQHPYGPQVSLEISAYSGRDCGAGGIWDPHIRVEVEDKTLVLSLYESEMLETALRVARQKVRPKR